MSALYRNKHKKMYKAVKQDDLSRRILAACLSASFVGQPLTALAGSITASNGKDYAPDKNGVFNIYAQQYNGKNNAVNQFQKFQLDADKIANLYFHTEKDSREAQNLLNFVDTRIDNQRDPERHPQQADRRQSVFPEPRRHGRGQGRRHQYRGSLCNGSFLDPGPYG